MPRPLWLTRRCWGPFPLQPQLVGACASRPRHIRASVTVLAPRTLLPPPAFYRRHLIPILPENQPAFCFLQLCREEWN